MLAVFGLGGCGSAADLTALDDYATQDNQICAATEKQWKALGEGSAQLERAEYVRRVNAQVKGWSEMVAALERLDAPADRVGELGVLYDSADVLTRQLGRIGRLISAGKDAEADRIVGDFALKYVGLKKQFAELGITKCPDDVRGS